MRHSIPSQPASAHARTHAEPVARNLSTPPTGRAAMIVRVVTESLCVASCGALHARCLASRTASVYGQASFRTHLE